MEKDIMEKFYDAWQWLDDHPLFTPDGIGGGGCSCLQIEVVKVNPENETIEDDERLNTTIRIWLEGGTYTDDMYPEMGNGEYPGWTSDYDLSTGGKTFEEAFLNFVENVRKKYHDYGEYSSIKYSKKKYRISGQV